MEIERKYLIKSIPENLKDFPCRIIEQGYLNTDPVVRIRKDDNNFELTYKSKGLMVRKEYNRRRPCTAHSCRSRIFR